MKRKIYKRFNYFNNDIWYNINLLTFGWPPPITYNGTEDFQNFYRREIRQPQKRLREMCYLPGQIRSQNWIACVQLYNIFHTHFVMLLILNCWRIKRCYYDM